jgi:hypothetical protein
MVLPFFSQRVFKSSSTQQSVHLTLGILRTSQAVFYALSFFWLDGFAVPAPAQVTQTVGRFRAKSEGVMATKDLSNSASWLGWLGATRLAIWAGLLKGDVMHHLRKQVGNSAKIERCSMKEKRLDVQCAGLLLLDDSDFSSLLFLRYGCEKCKTHDEYCVDCTLKLYEVLNSEKYAEFYAKPEKERNEIFVTLENEWVAKHQNAQQSVQLTAFGVDSPALNPLQMSLFAEVLPATIGGN